MTETQPIDLKLAFQMQATRFLLHESLNDWTEEGERQQDAVETIRFLIHNISNGYMNYTGAMIALLDVMNPREEE